jgi:glycosyltransferase involved in cell wall biosynthesis
MTENPVNGPTISIIVPLYNKAAYIEQCLTSLCTQTLGDLEIIVVDDGSDDGSTSIVQALAQNDSRIQLLRQKNKGPGAARNTGLLVAHGKFISLVDADDWIEPEFCAELLSVLKKSKVGCARCGQILERGTRKKVRAYTPARKTVITYGRILYKHLFGRVCKPLFTACGTLYDRKELEIHRLSFDSELRNLEDVLFNAELFAQDLPVAFSSRTLYHVREVRGSASHTPTALPATWSLFKQRIRELEHKSAIAQQGRYAFFVYRVVVRLIIIRDWFRRQFRQSQQQHPQSH